MAIGKAGDIDHLMPWPIDYLRPVVDISNPAALTFETQMGQKWSTLQDYTNDICGSCFSKIAVILT